MRPFTLAHEVIMYPVLFELFGYPLHLYSLMITIGCIAGLWLAVSYSKRIGMDHLLIMDLCWWLILGGYLGSRVIFMIVNWEHHWYPCLDYTYYNQLNPEAQLTGPDCWPLLAFWSGGLVFYGAFLGGIAVLWWFAKRHKLPLLKTADVLMPAFAVGQFFGRIGCLAAGCCWGKPTDLAWGIQFPRRSMVFHQHLEQGLVSAGDSLSLPVHPTQIYDSTYGILLFATLYWIRERKRYDGQVLVWWLFLYPLLRSLVELFRGDSERGFVFKLVYEPLNSLLGLPEGSVTFMSTSQFISLGVMTVAGAAILYLRAHAQDVEAESP